jgi:F-type H+-transporting ATPase subunit epsilon
MKKLTLRIISQEEQLLEKKVESVTAVTTTGQVTILPDHIPLFSQLDYGELVYRDEGEEHSFAISKGFLDVDPDDTVTAIVDTAVAARDISMQKAQEAIQAARETMQISEDERELLQAEASLRQAMLEVQIAQKSKKSNV